MMPSPSFEQKQVEDEIVYIHNDSNLRIMCACVK